MKFAIIVFVGVLVGAALPSAFRANSERTTQQAMQESREAQRPSIEAARAERAIVLEKRIAEINARYQVALDVVEDQRRTFKAHR